MQGGDAPGSGEVKGERGPLRWCVPTPPAGRSGQTRHRLVLESTWVVGVVAYGLARTLVVWGALGDYGVNPWIYGVIDLVSSVPYAIGTARVVTGVMDRELGPGAPWGLIAVAAFFVPDLYIVVAGHGMPTVVYVVLGVWVLIAAVLAARAVAGKIRTARLEATGAGVYPTTTVRACSAHGRTACEHEPRRSGATGVVTLLFTDLVGSSAMLDSLGDERRRGPCGAPTSDSCADRSPRPVATR